MYNIFYKMKKTLRKSRKKRGGYIPHIPHKSKRKTASRKKSKSRRTKTNSF